jgi:hypothetical protein
MTADTDTLERELLHDLQSLGDLLSEDEFGRELYRALANTRWRKPGGGEGHISVSWSRAEEIVNTLRAQQGEGPLTLAQTGGEGEVSGRVTDALGGAGWTSRHQDTSRHDASHADRPSSPPPGDQGERDAPVGDSHAWEREAHAAADQEQRRRLE